MYVDALRDRPPDEPILASLEHVFSDIASTVVSHPGDIEAHVDLLWTSRAMARYRSVLLDEAIRMVTEVVAARTGTDATIDVYPHLVTAAAISALVTAFQFPSAAGPAPHDRERLVRECFALLRAGFERAGAVST